MPILPDQAEIAHHRREHLSGLASYSKIVSVLAQQRQEISSIYQCNRLASGPLVGIATPCNRTSDGLQISVEPNIRPFRDGRQHRTWNHEIRGSMLRIAPE
jgi:hypothetical protein